MSSKARRVPLAHLKNGVNTAEDGIAVHQGMLKGPKGRLALLREENARFCAPKTRIPTPAPKKKPSQEAPSRGNFVSKIPSPTTISSTLEGPATSQNKDEDASSGIVKDKRQQQGSPHAQEPAFGNSDEDREAVTPEAQVQGHTELEGITSEALQLSEDIATQLACTPAAHAPMSPEEDASVSGQQASMSSPQALAASSPQVAGMGTPLDFTSTLNLEEFDGSTLAVAAAAEEATFGSIVGGAECTPAAEKALKAWLAANTPSQPGRGSAYRGNQTPGRLLATPALQGLLQQLRISTPALGAQGIASTPFLAGLARTLPELTPGLTPDSTAAAFWGPQGSDTSPTSAEAAAENLANALTAQQTEQDEGLLESPVQAQSPGTPSDAWAELVDLTPGPRDHSDISLWVSPMGSSPGSCRAAAIDSPSFADGCPAVSNAAQARRSTAATHKKHVSWGSDTEHSIVQQESTQGEQIGEADKQLDTESVGSASPFEIVKVHDVSEAGAGNKVAIPHEAASAGSTAKADSEPKQLRVATPVNPAPGIGRGCAGIPRAVESCQVIHPPPVPSTPDCAIADERVEGTLAPANTPIDPEHAARSAPLTTYQLMLAHIVGGSYTSPTVGRPGSPVPARLGSPATPRGQRARSYTPCLLATPAAGTVLRTRSRLGPGGLAGAIAAARTPATLQRRPPRTPATARGFLVTPIQLRGGFGAAARGGTPGTALSVGRGSLESWLARTGLNEKVDSPARASLEALWMRAGQAGSLRLEVETVRVAEQEKALSEARQHLQQWDCLMQHNASLEAENAELRSELAAIAAAREAAESALLRASAERAVAAEAAAGQQVLAAAEAERCKTTGLRLLELADHAALVAAAYEDEKQALLEELTASRQRLAAAQDAAACAHKSPATSDRHQAAIEAQLHDARRAPHLPVTFLYDNPLQSLKALYEYSEAMAACEAAQEAAAAAAEEKARLLTELQEARAALAAAASAADTAGAAHDGEAACLAAQLKEAHEALFELEMDALEAQRITQETHDILALDDAPEPIVANEADIKEMQQVVEAASDANKAYEEENERLREELEAAQEQLAAVKHQQASLTTAEQTEADGNVSTGGNATVLAAQEQEDDESTPTKRPSETAALVSAAAAAHAAPVTFFGSHRVFLGPRTADVLAASTAAAGPVASVPRRQATPQSASPVAAWCTVTDRLRRLRADLEDTSNTMHLLRSAQKVPLPLPAPEQEAAESLSLELIALVPETEPAAELSPVSKAAPEVPPVIKAASPDPAEQPSSEAEDQAAAEAVARVDERQREETPEAAAERIQLVLRIGHLTPPPEETEACTPEPKRKAPVREEAETSPEMDTPVQQPRFGLWGRRGGARKKASASEEREFRRRAAALKIRISPYFNRRRDATEAE